MSTSFGRRLRFGISSIIVLLATLVSVVLANVLAARFPLRLDVTATAEHTLSPRSRQLLASLREPHLVEIIGNLRTLNPQARQDVLDVLDQFKSGSPNIDVGFLDISSPAGASSYQSLLTQFVDRERQTQAPSRAAVDKALADFPALIDIAENWLAPTLISLKRPFAQSPLASPANEDYLTRAANIAKLNGTTLREAQTAARNALQDHEGPVEVPAVDQAAAILGAALAKVSKDWQTFTEDFKAVADNPKAGSLRDVVRPIAQQLAARRDTIAVFTDILSRVAPSDSQRLVAAVRRSGQVVIAGPAGLRLIELPALFNVGGDVTGRADIRRRAEELVSTSLASLSNPHRPIVILTMCEPTTLAKAPFFTKFRERFTTAGIDVLEWNINDPSQDRPPATTAIDSTGTRPIVYIARCPDTSRPKLGDEPSGLDRHAKLCAALAQVAQSGGNILLSIGPSIVPIASSPDPADQVLSQFGLRALSDRTVMTELRITGGRVVDPDISLTPADASKDFPIDRALAGLPTFLPWPTPIGITDLNARVILQAESSNNRWLESQWRNYKLVPRDQRGSVADPPKYDPQFDSNQGPWPIVVAASRETQGKRQRLITVGSNDWFVDPVTTQTQGNVDGRLSLANPGNVELLDAAVSWLADQDDLIAQSAAARATPLIAPIPDGMLLWLRVGVILGVPLLVLLLGLLHRAVFG